MNFGDRMAALKRQRKLERLAQVRQAIANDHDVTMPLDNEHKREDWERPRPRPVVTSGKGRWCPGCRTRRPDSAFPSVTGWCVVHVSGYSTTPRRPYGSPSHRGNVGVGDA
jgi:hypothetical protein